jgi:uncharacterized membrane-anchored protein YjiN (DUF445 family)
MSAANQVGRLAGWSLVGALALAVLARLLERFAPIPFWGGLLSAFAEAALVGGLADWFAVRALFAHPFGVPFPHTALIPRNRERIVREVCELVQHEWLPQSLLRAKIEAFDFVEQGLLPLIEPLKPHLREVLRSVGRDLLNELSPDDLADFAARALAGVIDEERVAPFLEDLARQAREQDWLMPLLGEVVKKMQQWADAPEARVAIRARLEQAASSYREGNLWRTITFELAEAFGGVDLDHATRALQEEIKRFAADQLRDGGQLRTMVHDGLRNIERRLREDPDFLVEIKTFVLETAETGSLTALLRPVLTSLRAEGQRELDREGSHFVELALRQIENWVRRLASEVELRAKLNAWCRREAALLIDKHHNLVGALVAEQMNRLSEKDLSALIQNKVGEDLNWIRLNGTFVGGLVGMTLYLSFALVRWLLG